MSNKNSASAKTVINEDSRFEINGELFFPIGLFSVPYAESFPEIKRAGFNTVHSYEFERTCFINPQSKNRIKRMNYVKTFDGWGDEAARNYLSAAADHGLMSVMGFNRPGGDSASFFSEKGKEQMKQRISSVADCPSLFAWYLYDEPENENICSEDLMYGRKTVEAMDPGHPTIVATYMMKHINDYAKTAKVIMHDIYPIPVQSEPHYLDLSIVGKNMAKIKKIIGHNPLIAVIQAFDRQAYSWNLPDSRPPTFQELRCMTYQSIANDVSGIFYFSYDNELHSNRAKDNPGGWRKLSDMGNELQALMPALVSPSDPNVKIEGSVMACTRKVNKEETWVIVTNPGLSPFKANIILTGEKTSGRVYNLFDIPAQFNINGNLEIEIEPYGCRALRIQLLQTNK